MKGTKCTFDLDSVQIGFLMAMCPNATKCTNVGEKPHDAAIIGILSPANYKENSVDVIQF